MKRFVFACAGLLSAAAMAVPAAAQAAPTTCQVTGHMLEGDFDPGSDVTTYPGGNNEIDNFTHPIYLTGGLSGTGFDQERSWGNFVNGDFTSHDDVTFDPSAATYATPMTVTCADGTTRTGNLEINFLAQGSFVTNGGLGSFHATFQVVHSSGGLAGTTGQGSMTGQPGVPGGNGDYTATLQLP
jgi:hypothetical protein